MSDLRETALWQAFEAKADEHQIVLVEDLAFKAAARLDLVRDTFPTYTLHNRLHACNVVTLMGELLGPRVKDVTPLEGAILILSAYLHDIGMVFTEEERNSIAQEPRFQDFLGSTPRAFLMLREGQEGKNGQPHDVPPDVAEWYCRWAHAERVHLYLSKLPEDEISWGIIPLRRELGLVCHSHNFSLKELWDRQLDKGFLGEADLLFCAILLRLADILDFDNSRSPEEVYNYLRLAEQKSSRDRASDTEWKKHLGTEGFKFSEQREDHYELIFKAAPDHPAVEHDIREFLDTIETELRQCGSLLAHCAAKWQSLVLPYSINRKYIISRGYKYGEHRFALEQEQILDLLMGENIYEDRYVFVRELVQNSIDTTRHRMYFENSRGRADFQPQPIRFSTWTDRDGYQWVRIDDAGMGMDESVILKYFLRVGASYYRSAEFKADLLRYQAQGQAEFVPISRFGIGILSCFIAGDRLEVSTYRLATGEQSSGPLRLSMSGLRSFFTLHLARDYHLPGDMPNEFGETEGFRKEAGTSIAVRLNPLLDHSQFDVRKSLEKYLLHPPVAIECQGKPVGEDYRAAILEPWLKQPVEVPLGEAEMRQVERVFGFKLSQPVCVRLTPLDLTKHSLSPHLRGQAAMLMLSAAEADLKRIADRTDGVREMRVNFDVYDRSLQAQFSFRNDALMDRLGIGQRSRVSGKERVQEFVVHARTLVAQLAPEEIWLLRELEYASERLDGGYPDGVDMIWRNLFAQIGDHARNPRYALAAALLWRKGKGQASEDALQTAHSLHRLTGSGSLARTFYEAAASSTDPRSDPAEVEARWVAFEQMARDYQREHGYDPNDTTDDWRKKFRELQAVAASHMEFVKSYTQAEREASISLGENLGAVRWAADMHRASDRWLSHNGMHIPTGTTYSPKLGLRGPATGTAVVGQVALRDALRPNLSLSRDELRELPWEAYSHLALALSRASRAETAVSGAAQHHGLLVDGLTKKTFLLGRILQDPQISLRGAWADEQVIETTAGFRSLNEIRADASKGERVALKNDLLRSSSYPYRPEFLLYCAATLIQIGLTVELDVGDRTELVVRAADPPVLLDGQMHFPPLFFVSYRNSDLLLKSGYPLSLNHPFSRWLIDHAGELQDKYPGIFESLRTKTSSTSLPIDELNAALDRLRQIHPKLVPQTLKLQKEDYA